jgi:tRNA(Met) C34 N-acetyltransferase TmcA
MPESQPIESSDVPRGTILDKPYLDAGDVARRLGVTRGVVVDDVRRGMDGKLGTLTGQVFDGGICVVHASELDQLEYHRQRLADHSSGAP